MQELEQRGVALRRLRLEDSKTGLNGRAILRFEPNKAHNYVDTTGQRKCICKSKSNLYARGTFSMDTVLVNFLRRLRKYTDSANLWRQKHRELMVASQYTTL